MSAAVRSLAPADAASPGLRRTFHLIPHTHWDREWYLPRAAFLARLVPMLDELLDTLEQEPAARFVLDGQTVLVEDYLSVRPEARPRLCAAVGRGALAVGPWYVLADELIPAGESLVRNLLHGARDAADLGRRMEVLYSPDAFGHPASLPALAREFGIERAVAWRGVPSATVPDRDLVRWVAPSGETVLLYCLPRSGYEVGAALGRGGDLERAWQELRDPLLARSVTAHVAVLIGADHHAPPPDLLEMRDRLQRLEPAHAVLLSTLDDFFDAVQATRGVAGARRRHLPLLRGPLRHHGHVWLLQGVHGTRSRLKRQHARVELLLTRLAEPLAALAAFYGGQDRRPLLQHAWRTLLQAQFHDTLGGCCADPVAMEQTVRLAQVEAMAREVALASLHELTGHDPDCARLSPRRARPVLILWNPCPRARGGVAVAELRFFRRDLPVGPAPARQRRARGRGLRQVVLVDPLGRAIPVQVLAARRGVERRDARRHYPDQDEVDRVWIAFQAPVVPGLGTAAMMPRPAAQGHRTLRPPSAGLRVERTSLANRYVSVSVTHDGRLTLEDRGTGERYPGLGALEDEPDLGDTYTASLPGPVRRVPLLPGSLRIAARGPLVGALELRSHAAPVRLLIVLHADSPILRLRLDLDNHGHDHRMRLRFPVRVRGAALAGVAFGVERVVPARRRTPHPDTLEQPVGTVPVHRFVVAAAGSRGLALLVPGFAQGEWTATGDLFLTVLRAVGELSRDNLPERPGHAGWPTPTPLAQECGPHTVELAVTPINEAAVRHPHQLERLWEEAFLPLQAVFIRDFTGRVADQGGITLKGEGLVATAVKPPEVGAGLVLRCMNTCNAPVTGRWVVTGPRVRASRTRADETDVEPLAVDSGGAVHFTAPPLGVATTRVVPVLG